MVDRSTVHAPTIPRPPLPDVCLAAALGVAGLVEVALTTSDFVVLAPVVSTFAGRCRERRRRSLLCGA